jgi:hypothetical protein
MDGFGRVDICGDFRHSVAATGQIPPSQHLCRDGKGMPQCRRAVIGIIAARFFSEGDDLCTTAQGLAAFRTGRAFETLNCEPLMMSRHEIGEGVWDANE